MVTCLERGADLHTAQLMPLPLTVSCFSKIQIGFAFLVRAHPGSPGQRAVKWVKCVLLHLLLSTASSLFSYHAAQYYVEWNKNNYTFSNHQINLTATCNKGKITILRCVQSDTEHTETCANTQAHVYICTQPFHRQLRGMPRPDCGKETSNDSWTPFLTMSQQCQTVTAKVCSQHMN